MKLEKGVYFRQYGDITYLRHVGQRRDFILGGIANDFLEFVRSHPGCSTDELSAALAKEYELDDPEEFVHDMSSFEQELTELCILENPMGKKVEESVIDYVRNMALAEGKFYSATLEITYLCNENCVHCYADSDIDLSKELTLAEYRNLLDQLWELGCMEILFTGGEVTLRKDFLDIISYAVEKGFVVDVYTNGLALKQEHILRLAELCVNSVSFSVYGPDPQTHDGITGVPGSFDQALKNMLLCKCAGLDTYAKTVVMNQNYDGLEDLFRLGQLAGISINTSMVVTASHKGRPADGFRLMDPEKYKTVTELSMKYDISGDASPCPDGHEIGLCGAGSFSLSVDPYGNVMPCNAIHLAMGNIRQKSLREIRDDAPLLHTLSELRFEQVCPSKGNCKHARWCAMCLGSAYSEKQSWKPTPDICMIARGVHSANLNMTVCRLEESHSAGRDEQNVGKEVIQL